MSTKVKRLIVDIEVSGNKGYFWESGFKLDVPYINIVEERQVICIGWKWEGEKQIQCDTWSGKSDKNLLKWFAPLLEEADVVIGHNHDRFDLPWIRARCIYHRIPVTPLIKTYDTFQVGRRLFKFNSNALAYLGPFLKIGQKIKTDYQLWHEVMKGNPKALAKMVKYCKNDVKDTEALYHLMEPYGPLKTHEGVVDGKGKESCPKCGSRYTHCRGFAVTAMGTKKQRMQCRECGRWFEAPAPKELQSKPPKRCKMHPRYRAVKRPTSDCHTCLKIWRESGGR